MSIDMLDILTLVHRFADIQTASRIRRACRRLSALITHTKLYIIMDDDIIYKCITDNKLHRLGGPAIKYTSERECWYRAGIAHREYHPQCVEGYFRKYIVDGIFHRETGPSAITYIQERWYSRGLLHRKTGPADIDMWNYTWYTLGKEHRIDKPTYGNVYMIRGKRHRIFSVAVNRYMMSDYWEVDGTVIRK